MKVTNFLKLTKYDSSNQSKGDFLISVDRIVRTDPSETLPEGLVVLVTEGTGNTRFPYVREIEFLKALKASGASIV